MIFLQSKLMKKHFVVSLVGSMISVTLIFFVATFVLTQSIQDGINERNELMAKTLSNHVIAVGEQLVNEVEQMSSRARLLADSEREEELHQELNQLVSQHAFFSSVYVFNEDGKRYLSVPKEELLLQDKHIDNIKSRIQWSQTHYLSDLITLKNGTKTIVVSVPLINENGKFKGEVSVLVNLKSLSAALSQTKIGEEGVNAIIDREGKIVAHTDTNYIGMPLDSKPVRTFLSKSQIGTWEGNLFHETFTIAYRSIPMSGFGLIVGEPKEQSVIPIVTVQRALLKGLIVVFFFVIIMTLFATARIVTPISDIIHQAKEYQRGKRQHFNPIHTNDELQELSVTIHDMASELMNHSRKLANILESIPYAVITTDQNGRILTFNKGAETLTGCNRSELLGRYIFEITLQNDSFEEDFSWNTFLTGAEFIDREAILIDKENEKHQVSIYSDTFMGGLKNKEGILFIIRNVGEMKKLEKYVRENERLAALGQLTSGIAHEIKNPLSIIQAAAEGIQLETREHEVNQNLIKELSDDILETTERMNLLLTDFLKMAKEDDGVTTEKVNLVFLLDELLSLLRKKFDERYINVNYDYKKYQEAYVLSNETRLTQVFLNIILNGMQAMDTGQQLTIDLEDQILKWDVKIRDTGHGIPSSKINWIFTPFYTTKSDGTGLGLSIAYELITQQGGEIRVESEEGIGTTFYISLPKYEEEREDLNGIDITSG